MDTGTPSSSCCIQCGSGRALAGGGTSAAGANIDRRTCYKSIPSIFFHVVLVSGIYARAVSENNRHESLWRFNKASIKPFQSQLSPELRVTGSPLDGNAMDYELVEGHFIAVFVKALIEHNWCGRKLKSGGRASCVQVKQDPQVPPLWR